VCRSYICFPRSRANQSLILVTLHSLPYHNVPPLYTPLFQPIYPLSYLQILVSISSETDLSEVLQIEQVFTNVPKGLVAKKEDWEKAFGTEDMGKAVEEVRISDLGSRCTAEG